MAQQAADHRLHDHKPLLKPDFQGCGASSKDWEEEGRDKGAHRIHANEDVPSDVRFTSAATNDSFMLMPSNYSEGDIVAMDRAYINYGKFEELTRRDIIYVTKMKKNLVYEIKKDEMIMTTDGLMEYRIQNVAFTKKVKGSEDINDM